MLDLPQLPAGAARWPPGVAQGAGQPPCGGLCSHGPGDSEGRTDKDPDSAGLGPQQVPFIFCIPLHPSPTLLLHIHMAPLTSQNPLHNHIPHTPLCLLRSPNYIHILYSPHPYTIHCPLPSHSPQDSQHPTAPLCHIAHNLHTPA